MSRTDRLRGFVNVYSTLGGLFLAYLQFVPSRLAEVLNAPLYAGYQLAVIFALLLGVILGVYYMANVIRDEADRITETMTEGDFIETLDSMVSNEDDGVATDGGKKSASVEKELEENPSSFLNRFAIEPSGKGALIGTAVGGILGLLFGSSAIFIGGIIGALVGNELEYQNIKRKRRSILGIDTQEGELSQDLIFDVLKNRRRRTVLKILDENDGKITLDELSLEIAKMEESELIENHRKSVYTSLYETHIPKLASVNVVRYQKDEGVVSKGENYDEFLPYIRTSYDGITNLNSDALFDVLKNRRRRYVLQTLLEEGGVVELAALAEQVASLENEVPVEQLSENERKSVFTALYQTHLPKLHDSGLIEFDQRSGIIKAKEQTKDLQEISPLPVFLDISRTTFEFSFAKFNIIVSAFALLGYTAIKYRYRLPLGLNLETLFLIYTLVIGGGSLYQYFWSAEE